MSWTEADARRSNRRWVILAIALLAVPVVVVVSLRFVPYAWSWTMWSSKLASARSVTDYQAVPADASYAVVVKRLGEPLYSGPGFEDSDGPIAGVYYWRDSDGRDVRALVMDWGGGDARIVGSMKVGEW